MDKYVPVRVQSQLSEIMNAVFGDTEFGHILNIEERKLFDSLHSALLIDDGVANLL